MKAVILAAGYGKRIGELTNFLPKPLIPVVNKPILQHVIERLYEAGLNDLIVVVGHLKDQINSFLTNFQYKKVKITIRQAENFDKGPIYSFAAALDEIGKESFLLIPADFLVEPSIISDFVQKGYGYRLALTFRGSVLNSKHSSMYVSRNRELPQVLGISSKVIEGEFDIRLLLPLLYCHTELKSYVENCQNMSKSKVIDAVQLYLKKGNFAPAFMIKEGYWFDLDTIEDFIFANSFFLDQANKIKQLSGEISRNSVFNEPILVGNNCKIEDHCVIGPNVSIGDNSEIGENTKIRNAIICPFSKVPSNADINDAIFFKDIYH